MPTTDPFGVEGTQLLSRLGELLHAASLPFLIGGDWNAPPALLGRLGWASKLRGRIVAPASPTCASGKRGWRTLDNFVIYDALAPSVVSCTVALNAAIEPRRPVLLRLRGKLVPQCITVLQAPRKFPRERPQGPLPAPPAQWEGVIQRLEDGGDQQQMNT
eukprot:4985487-Pyramimonas_sp.AAC.1